MSLKHIKIPGFQTKSGYISNINLSYETFGRPLHTAPVVLVIHALTGNSNVCGLNGWWTDLIGKDKCINTEDYTILAFNIPGNGYDKKPEHLIEDYKEFIALDIANIFAIGLQELKIENLFAAIGGSVGGGLIWELAALKPNLIENLIPVATDWKSTDWLIANCHIQDSILNNSEKPLFDARLHAMTLYRTPESFRSKFKRTKKSDDYFNVESWLDHHGKVLNNRFQLAAYKLMNQILRTIDITQDRDNFMEVASKIESNIHLVTINSDLFFKAEENWNTYVELKSVKENVYISEIKSVHGHDAFLIEFNQLSNFVKPIFNSEIPYEFEPVLNKCL
ncbi:MAG: alpha/beta fold hydrolase [Bacteroidota bacterium]